jgi:hypothetical protein
MCRYLWIGLIATFAFVGCDKRSEDSNKGPESVKLGPAAPVSDKAVPPAPATPDPVPVKPGEAATHVAGRGGATGVLDLELVEHGKLFVLRDEAYEISFPIKPLIEGSDQVAPSGAKLHTASVVASNDSEIYGLLLIPVPKGIPYDIEKGLTGARDDALKNINAKLVSETPTPFGGLQGRKATGRAEVGGKDLQIDFYFAYDKYHHTMIGLLVATTQAAPPKEVANFIASFKVNPDGQAPPAGNGT